MRNIYLLIFNLLSVAVFCQDLRIPNTPAFSILDFEPASVMRPTSAKKLSSDVLSSFDKDGKLLLNLGLEITPYWLKNRPYLTREEYLNPSTLQTILQTFTLSAATVKDTISNNNNLGVGYRFEIYKGILNTEVGKLEKQSLEIESTINGILLVKNINSMSPIADYSTATADVLLQLNNMKVSQARIAEFEKKAKDIFQQPNYNETIDDFLTELSSFYATQSSDLVDTIREMVNKRTGFSLETAGAVKLITSQSDNSLQKAGFWLNANYYMSDKDAATITARFMYNTTDITSTNTDLGISYIRQEKEFNISIEAMMRWYRSEIPDLNYLEQPITRLEKDFTYRLAAQVSYSIAEDISLNLSLGKQFEDARINGTSIFTILGLNYSLFHRQFAK
ncbi:MAG: hypothetical protein ACOH1O_10465 [Flavobacterium sp.]